MSGLPLAAVRILRSSSAFAARAVEVAGVVTMLLDISEVHMRMGAWAWDRGSEAGQVRKHLAPPAPLFT